MRVLPFASVTAISGRIVLSVESGALICVHVAPLSFERQTPRP